MGNYISDAMLTKLQSAGTVKEQKTKICSCDMCSICHHTSEITLRLYDVVAGVFRDLRVTCIVRTLNNNNYDVILGREVLHTHPWILKLHTQLLLLQYHKQKTQQNEPMTIDMEETLQPMWKEVTKQCNSHEQTITTPCSSVAAMWPGE